MKKYLFLAIAATAAFGYGCSSDELANDPIVNGNGVIVASLDDAGTRTILDTEDANKVLWASGDAISVLSSSANTQYKLASGQNTASATFTGNDVDDAAVVLYPYTRGASYDGTTISFTLSASAYTYTESNPTYTNKAPMAGIIADSSNPGSVSLKHAGAVVDITINDVPAGYTYATLTSGTSDKNATAVPISGTASITFDGEGTPTLAITDNAAYEAKVTFASSTSAQNVRLIFPIPAGTYGSLELRLGGKESGKTAFVTSWTDKEVKRAGRYYAEKTVDSVTGTIPTEANSASDATTALQSSNAVVVDMSSDNSSSATISLPAADEEASSSAVSLTLNNVGSSQAITIGEASNSTASAEVTVAASAASSTISSLVVSLPSSTVTLAASSDAVTYESVTASTADNTLKVGKGVTICKLKVMKGNIRVKEGAKVESITRENNSDETTTVFIETGATVGNLNSIEADKSFTIVKSGDSELVASNAHFFRATYLSDFYCDLYKTFTNDGEYYTFKNFMKDYDLEFTLDANNCMTLMNGSWYYSYWYAGPDTYNSSYPLYLTAEDGYYVDGCFIYGANGSWYNFLDLSNTYTGGKDDDTFKYSGYICLNYYKYKVVEDGDDEYIGNGYDYIYINFNSNE
jgi:uncharacterized Zn ribbon protein